MDMDFPKLRPIEAIPVRDNQICLRDPLRISDKLIFIPHNVFFIVSLFDGNHSILDIQAAYTRQFGDLLFSDKVKELIERLDSCLFLDNSHFLEFRDRVIDEFKKSAVREVSHVGVSYENDKEALKKQLGELLSEHGEIDDHNTETSEGTLRGIIAPHIDIKRGGACFAKSYSVLSRETDATTFVILGISHTQTRRRFVLCAKDFNTPLGIIPADRDFIDCLSTKCKTDFFEDEFVHRSEHSIEFQVVMLRSIFPDKRDLRIVPVLCSSFDEIHTESSPRDAPEFQDFTLALTEVLRERGDQTCIIAGVDLSHLGQRFGQNINITPLLLQEAKEKDLEMIQKILYPDAEGFFRLIQNEKDRRNVCGVPAIYTLLQIIDVKNARLLKYEQSVDTASQSVVTFMGAAFYA